MKTIRCGSSGGRARRACAPIGTTRCRPVTPRSRRAGSVVDYTPEAIARGIVSLLDDEVARARAAELGAQSDWQRVLDQAFGLLI